MPTLTTNQPLVQLWGRIKSRIKLLFTTKVIITGPSPIAELPVELTEEILSYFVGDMDALLACSLTCRLWYLATVRHLHYSLTTDHDSVAPMDKMHPMQWPEPLKKMYEFGLPPLVKRLRVRVWYFNAWFTPKELEGCNLRYFSAFKNLQELGIDDLAVSSFIPNLRQYFGHLSPTLRFLALRRPYGSSRQIVYFIGLFPNLQDLKIHYLSLRDEGETTADTTLVPLSSPPLRGRLTLALFTREQILKDMVTLFGGLRFHRMDLFGVKCLPLLLEQCAETLETLRLYPTDPYAKSLCFDLSRNKSLRTLETTAQSITRAGGSAPEFLKTVLSSVASPGMLDVVITYHDCDLGGWSFCGTCRRDLICIQHRLRPNLYGFPWHLTVLHKIHSARKFRLVLCMDVRLSMEDCGMQLLESAVKEEKVKGGFKYLVCGPVITCETRTIRTRCMDCYTGTTGAKVLASAL